jgi:photosystem II stability/assembly factor-like uncharacterized protein
MLRVAKNKFAFVALLTGFAIGSNPLYSTSAGAANSPTKIQRMNTFVGGDIHTLTYTKSGLFVTGHEAGSYSIDEGMKWKNIASLNSADIMGWATTDLGFLAGGHTGLFRSTNSGKTFTRFNFYGKASDVHSLGAADKYVYMGSPQVGFLRSVNSGKSWKVVNQKFGQGFMGSMLVDPSNPLRVLAPDMSNGLVVTTDGGKSWMRYGGPEGVMSIDWNLKNPKEIVAIGMGFGAITRDDGKTWSKFSVPMGSSAIALSSNGSRIFVAVLAGDKATILNSDNVGKSWI